MVISIPNDIETIANMIKSSPNLFKGTIKNEESVFFKRKLRSSFLRSRKLPLNFLSFFMISSSSSLTQFFN